MLSTLLLLAQASDREALTQGIVGPLAAPDALPGGVVASKGAFVVLQAGGLPTGAAVRVGSGRALVVGHSVFFKDEALKSPANARFLSNALAWLGRRSLPGLRVGTLDVPPPEGWAKLGGPAPVSIPRRGLRAALAKIDVLVMDQAALDGDAPEQQAVVEWTKAGHGLLVSGPAWGWQQLNPGKDLVRDLSANQMLLPYGLGLSGDYDFGASTPEGTDDPLLQTDAALAALRKGGLRLKENAQATKTVSRALALDPPEGPLVAEINRLALAEGRSEGPTATRPMTARTPFSRVRAVLQDRTWREAAPEKVGVAPSAVDFPGEVPAAARRLVRTVTIDTKVPQWHGTGLYAAPGEVIKVVLPGSAAGKALGVRVGSHTDELWGASRWDRFPSISRRWALTKGETRVASPFGGAVFIDVPEGCRLGTISVAIEGAVPAPRFVRGVTTSAEWARQMAEPGGAWVELEGEKIVLSVPRSACADLKDPESLMAFWDETYGRARELYAAPPRPYAERYCVDRQISAGYMHSGYPIMTFEDVAKTFTDVAKLRGKGATWGFFHELGHNFQVADWTFEGTGEVTNNLFSLYASEKLNGITPATYGVAHPAMSPDAQHQRLTAYLAKGARFDDWKADPFLALTMGVQVREAFGWEPFTLAFASYRIDPPHLQSETDKHDAWLIRLSRATARNLGPFFVAWGVPTSEAARQAVANLPTWMPADWPR